MNHALSRLQYALRRHRTAVEALVAVIGTIGVVTAIIRWMPHDDAKLVLAPLGTVIAGVITAVLVEHWKRGEEHKSEGVDGTTAQN